MQVRPHSIKSRPRFLAALVLVPCLAGCFASPGGESSSDGGQPGSRLRVALAFPPAENFSPYGADATLLSRLGVTEGLTALDANGAAAPALAESWRRENDRTWRFTLREATFQDGADVTPSAVAAALTRATKAKPAPAALAGVTLDAKADGDRGIRITTAAADPVLPMRLSSPSLAVLSPKAYGEKGNPDPVGTATGPFEITKVGGGGSATLDRFDDYWGGRAQASGIDARFVKDGTARANAVRTGDVDIAEAIPVAQAATLDKATLKEGRHHPHHQPAAQHQDRSLQGPQAARRRPHGDRLLHHRQGRLRGVRRPGRGRLRSRRHLGREQAGEAKPDVRTPPSPTASGSPSPPTTTGPSCPRPPRWCNSSSRRPASR